MKLEEMTNAQLVNIILRKDDVETRLRKEIASLQNENKQLVEKRRAKEVTICLITAVICVVFMALLNL